MATGPTKKEKQEKPVMNVTAELYPHKTVFVIDKKITEEDAAKVKENIKSLLSVESEEKA